MPEPTRDQRHGERITATAQARRTAYDTGIQRWHAAHNEPDTTHLTRAAITACGLCDDDGYRGHQVCDHIDRAETTAAGIAAVRAALRKPR